MADWAAVFQVKRRGDPNSFNGPDRTVLSPYVWDTWEGIRVRHVYFRSYAYRKSGFSGQLAATYQDDTEEDRHLRLIHKANGAKPVTHVQLALADGTVFVYYALYSTDVPEDFQTILESPSVLKVLHAQHNDIRPLAYQFNMRVTAWSELSVMGRRMGAEFLAPFGHERPGLKKIAAIFGQQMAAYDHQEQVEWCQRELPDRLMGYAAKDAQVTLDVVLAEFDKRGFKTPHNVARYLRKLDLVDCGEQDDYATSPFLRDLMDNAKTGAFQPAPGASLCAVLSRMYTISRKQDPEDRSRWTLQQYQLDLLDYLLNYSIQPNRSIHPEDAMGDQALKAAKLVAGRYSGEVVAEYDEAN